jgi:hypothetical protein
LRAFRTQQRCGAAADRIASDSNQLRGDWQPMPEEVMNSDAYRPADVMSVRRFFVDYDTIFLSGNR